MVTVTDHVETLSVLSDSLGNYQVTGMVAGNYTVSFASSELNTQTLTGSLSPGETKRLIIGVRRFNSGGMILLSITFVEVS